MIRHRALTTIAMATLLAAPLAACTSNGENDPPTAETATQEAPTTDPADATPQERVKASFDASDAAAAEGWEDTSYIDEFFVPELAEKQRADDAKRAESGAIVTGERKLSHWTVVEETNTSAVVEFCDDTSALQATRDGEPVEIANKYGQSVGQFTLVRESNDEPWMIQKQGYYEEGTTCDEHFGD
ncbi:hypothetical protein [Brachybacterium fresconis]|uniref:DUF4440 domain-containing protein n=1 Tax=Brachybacterium fresconis TaxID=173363 RepID=A0ABS4YET7_9MICO|nr:hypothetical protein [Brachybacterium fresconis]MBP2407304.1 hypothetical protein [Brachybacterium fresconis]